MKSWVNPKWRAAAFWSVVNFAWMAAAWQWVERENWLWITPIALSINFLLLTYDQVLTFSSLHSEPLVGRDPWGVLKIVHHLSEKLKIGEPKVFLIEHPSAQVFTYARTRRHVRLFVTSGAIDLLSPRELEAALTFQMLAIARAQTVINYWVGAVLDLFFRLGHTFERGFAFVFGWAPRLSVWFIRPVIWLLQFLLLSPKDFERLDRETASMIANPEDLARALWKMDAYARTQPWRDAWVFAHMCMVSPMSFRPQPALQPRIRQLVGRFPL